MLVRVGLATGATAAMVVVSVAVAACSGGGAAADAGAPCDPSDRVPELHGSSGSIYLSEQVYDDSIGSSVWIEIWNVPRLEGHYVEVAREGDCVFYRQRELAFCDPPCEAGYFYCTADERCVPFPVHRSVGTIELAGLLQPVTIEPGEYGTYWGWEDEIDPIADLFRPGDAITVTASGAAGVPPFSAVVGGVSDMITDIGGSYVLVDGEDNLFSWTPQGDGSTIELVLEKGWHGAPGSDVIYCTAEDAQGSIAVPASLVASFPYYSGAMLFQHPGIIRRVSRAFVETECAPIEIMAASLRQFALGHVPPGE
jgi:hypothetical protein